MTKSHLLSLCKRTKLTVLDIDTDGEQAVVTVEPFSQNPASIVATWGKHGVNIIQVHTVLNGGRIEHVELTAVNA